MKLNVGSSCARGEYKEKEWVNLDMLKVARVNVVASGEFLPFRDDTFDEIRIIHVLEHVRRDKASVVLREAHRVAKSGAVVYVETPNLKELVRNLHLAFVHSDNVASHKWTTSIYGKSDRIGMEHYWGYTSDTLSGLLTEAGFSNVHEPNYHISQHHRQEPVILLSGEK